MMQMDIGDMVREDQGGPAEGPPAERRISVEECDVATGISAINKCLTRRTRKMYIYDVGYKLAHPDTYDIGGSYSDEQAPDIVPETWFFFTTTICPGNSHLLNLFLCHRRVGNISVGVSNGNELSHIKRKDRGMVSARLPETLEWHIFRTAQPNENYYVKTFCFSDAEVKSLEKSSLVIPVKLEINTFATIYNSYIKKMKLSHDFKNVLSKKDKTDFVLISVSKKQYPVHKIFLAAHSIVLRDLIKSKSSSDAHAFFDISDDDMELLLEFIYTGTIKDILNKDCFKLLEIADRFKLSNLIFLTQYALGEQINVENAVEIASFAEHYKLEKLQTTVFKFIKNNPKVLETEGWKNLDDVNLAKKLFQFMHTKQD